MTPSLTDLDLPVYAALLETIDQSVIFTDLEGQIRFWNSGATGIFGYSAQEMLGKTPALLYPEEDPSRLAEDLERILAGEDFVGEWRGRRRDGSNVWVEIRTTVVRDSAGNPIGFLGVSREVTEETRAESVRRKDETLEILSRLMTVLGETRFLLGRTDLSGPVRQEVSRIQRATERIREIARNLLASSGRRQTGQARQLDLNDAITRFQVGLEDVLGDRVELRLVLSPGVPPIRIDEDPLQRVLLELARNARDAMADGGTVFLETRELSITDSSAATDGVVVEPGCYVEMMVRDGEAMDSETTAHVFDPFLARKQNGQGTGLGLASVYWIVTQSGGYLFAESSPARGACFRVLLPASVEA
jgi:PAS domain S-box-containing protein